MRLCPLVCSPHHQQKMRKSSLSHSAKRFCYALSILSSSPANCQSVIPISFPLLKFICQFLPQTLSFDSFCLFFSRVRGFSLYRCDYYAFFFHRIAFLSFFSIESFGFEALRKRCGKSKKKRRISRNVGFPLLLSITGPILHTPIAMLKGIDRCVHYPTILWQGLIYHASPSIRDY